MNIKTDCTEFLGYIPCKPNKLHGVHCVEENGETCRYYKKTGTRILIIKLGAAGDVIRTTPLLKALREKYENAYIVWLTHFPDLVPAVSDDSNGVNKIYKWDSTSLYFLQSVSFDIVINLDKDEYACGFASLFEGRTKLYGYTIKENRPYPANALAEHKYMTGLFDDVSIANTKNYMQEIFEICDLKFGKEEYILPKHNGPGELNIAKDKKVIGLNTGCGGRWTSRLWPEKYWEELALLLLKKNYEVVLLGGPEEDEKNKRLSENTGAKYYGTFPLKTFIGVMDKCDAVVTVVTMAMHIAVGLKKQIILLNNIFNKHEFELYGRGKIVEPEKKCTCYFQPRCTNKDYHCLEHLYPQKIVEELTKLRI